MHKPSVMPAEIGRVLSLKAEKKEQKTVKVKNINGRRQASCKCGTWLDHWVRICGRPPPQHCAQAGCAARPELGAHVQKDSATDADWYIIPLCLKHSVRAESLEVFDTTVFVSAHVFATCGQQFLIGNALAHELRGSMEQIVQEQQVDIAQMQAHLSRARLAAVGPQDQPTGHPNEAQERSKEH